MIRTKKYWKDKSKKLKLAVCSLSDLIKRQNELIEQLKNEKKKK